MVQSTTISKSCITDKKRKDINRTGTTIGKNGKTNMVIYITHLKNLNLVPKSDFSTLSRPKP
jgi:hypothetical protein